MSPGTDQLESSQALWPISVGMPEIVMEAPEPVARGETLTLRGVVVIGRQLAPKVGITVEGEQAARSNAAGSFLLRHPVPPDAALGELALELAAPELDTTTRVAAVVKSATSIVVTPLERVRLGRPLPLEARLLDDRGLGIPNALIHYGPDASVTTGPDGVAAFALTTPDAEAGLSAVPLTFRFEGDGANLPLSYFVGLPVATAGINWLLWAGLPLLLVLGSAGGYLGRRLDLSLPKLREVGAIPLASRLGGSTAGSSPASPGVGRELIATQLELSFPDTAPEGERVWNVGQRVPLLCILTGDTGHPLARARVELDWGDSEATVRLTRPAGPMPGFLGRRYPGDLPGRRPFPGQPGPPAGHRQRGV